ncbi:hypothetical protein [Streptomyces sp. KL116D]|uniref:hypothetical protein n=1 Tax=Streptomyces sp. KL116D TaxID=3045152 RepID=UPI0035585CA0
MEKAADELVRAAAALYLEGSGYQEMGPGLTQHHVENGFFTYLVVPRHECLYLTQTTYF